MDFPISQESDIPIPINSAYGHGHGHGHLIHHQHHQQHQRHHHGPPSQLHNHIIPSSSSAPSNGTTIPAEEVEHAANYNQKKQQQLIRYRECLKNHAAAMGGSATDGCGEFMPSGEEGSLEALTCSACNCHRNFHRKVVEGEASSSSCDCYNPMNRGSGGRKLFNLGHHANSMKGILPPEAYGYPTISGGALVPAARSVPITAFHNMGFLPSESDEQEDGGGCDGGMVRAPPQQAVKKRFRTKFTQEQKEKLFDFAEKVGWKIQKQEESVVQQFCQEIGVKRRVLKVWMHNNKHNLAKKNCSSTTV
ncbi:hypothetical protein Nepgr_025685 [Nepenthes gracilis]|uniref:ZF-HD dimerization-type domain-containing protein n=1 Tax=Nepenthes gracilis TaxID=150966 RepID=A0AAD3T6X4_NEPGR|nr:hypothetical protein Nepgr_025685 [Nepenthes gracilis]